MYSSSFAAYLPDPGSQNRGWGPADHGPMFPNWKSQSSQEPKDSEDKKPAAALGWSSVARWEDVGGTYLWDTPHILGAQKQWLPASIFPYTNPWEFSNPILPLSHFMVAKMQRCGISLHHAVSHGVFYIRWMGFFLLTPFPSVAKHSLQMS